MAKTINQTVHFDASPHEIYEAYMDSAKHADFTGAEADIERKVGGKFKAHGTYLSGKILELVPDEKIVQTWRVFDWPEGQFSKLTLELKDDGDNCILQMTHEDVPDDAEEHINKGWYIKYWDPLKNRLKK